MSNQSHIINAFAQHKVAANLLMSMMIIAGILALTKLNIQFFPNFELDNVSVRVVWSGATAEDIEDGITNPLEQNLKTVDYLKNLTSTSSQGISAINLEFHEGTNMSQALEDVKQRVDEFRNLPLDAEKPEVQRISRYENVARLLVYGTDDINELRQLVNTFERELNQRGIDKVTINGLPDEEVRIEVDHLTQQRLQLSLDDIAKRIDEDSRDLPAGVIASEQGERELRALEQRREVQAFSELAIVSDGDTYIELGDVATITRGPEERGKTLSKDGHPVVEIQLQRTETGNSLTSAQILDEWLVDTRMTLPATIQLEVYDESWQLIKERILLLVKNGLGGLVLVVAILYLFLNGRVAFWVAVGIPVSFMATLGILYVAGGSINMISLFGLIMALGIIVDDAIVVGEDALAHYQSGEDPLMAAEGGARRMFVPVIASSLTTMAAFLPLMIIGGVIGNILFAIPLVIISVIAASLIESFLVLPGHLRGAFSHFKRDSEMGDSLRVRLDRRFENFRENKFRPLVTDALRHRGLTLSIALALLIFVIGLLASGRVQYSFFPSPEGNIIYANTEFVAGTSADDTQAFLAELEQALSDTDKEYGGVLSTAVTMHGSSLSGGRSNKSGDQLGSMTIELVSSEDRDVTNEAFIRSWRDKIVEPAGMETFTITSRRAGPPGRLLTVRLSGDDAMRLKQASIELREALTGIAGVSAIEDDMPYGREQLIYQLTPAGKALGLTTTDIGQQLRTAFDGKLVQIFQDGPDEVEVRVSLPKHERDQMSSLQRLNIRLDDGSFVPFTTVASWSSRQGFEALRHADSLLAVEVSADVDKRVNNANDIIAELKQGLLPELRSRYGVDFSLEGQSADQRDTRADMTKGLLIGLTLIYIVLAWVFSSYGWPLVVMSAIPFGLVGAITGHMVMGLDMTILSLFGFFGLSGIVVNDSIILVSFYQRLRQEGMQVTEALIEAATQRLRAVILTSLTTIAGLTPLLFETSLQAQFLIPMAVSIAFGLALATIQVLVVIPVILSYHESMHQWWLARRQKLSIQQA